MENRKNSDAQSRKGRPFSTSQSSKNRTISKTSFSSVSIRSTNRNDALQKQINTNKNKMLHESQQYFSSGFKKREPSFVSISS